MFPLLFAGVIPTPARHGHDRKASNWIIYIGIANHQTYAALNNPREKQSTNDPANTQQKDARWPSAVRLTHRCRTQHRFKHLIKTRNIKIATCRCLHSWNSTPRSFAYNSSGHVFKYKRQLWINVITFIARYFTCALSRQHVLYMYTYELLVGISWQKAAASLWFLLFQYICLYTWNQKRIRCRGDRWNTMYKCILEMHVIIWSSRPRCAFRWCSFTYSTSCPSHTIQN